MLVSDLRRDTIVLLLLLDPCRLLLLEGAFCGVGTGSTRLRFGGLSSAVNMFRKDGRAGRGDGEVSTTAAGRAFVTLDDIQKSALRERLHDVE